MGRFALTIVVCTLACLCPASAYPGSLSCSALNKAKTSVMYQVPQLSGAAPTAEADGTTYIPGKTYTLSGSVPGGSKKILVSAGTNGCCNNNGCSWTAPVGAGAVEIVMVGASGSSSGVYYATRTVNPPPPSTCPAGQGGTHPSCTVCAPGKYKAAAGNAACEACSAGQVQPATEQTSCVACSAGRFQPSDGQAVCTACAAGKFRDTNAAASSSEAIACKACETGRYQNQDAQTECAPCAAGKYRDAANVAASSSEDTACKACAADTFQGDAAQVSCQTCAAGQHTASLTGQTSCVSLPSQACSSGCDAGTKCENGMCQSCPAGRFQEAKHSGEIEFCKACATGEYQDRTGQPACNKCIAGKYRDTSAAASTAESTACESCGPGQHQDLEAQTSCKGAACVAGKFSALQAQAAPVTCTDCASGQYQDGLGQMTCKGNACVPGKYGQAGQTAPAPCSDCTSGRFSAGAGETHCLACPAGQHQPLVSQASCVVEPTKPHKTSIEFTLASNVIGGASDNLLLAPQGSNTVHFSHGTGTAFAFHGPDNRGTALVTWRSAASCTTPAAVGDTTAGGQAWDCEVELSNGATRIGVLAYRFDPSGSATFRFTVQKKTWAAFGFKKASDPIMKGWAVVAKYADARRQLAGTEAGTPTAKPYAMTGMPSPGKSIHTVMTELSVAQSGLSTAPVAAFVPGDSALTPPPTPAPTPKPASSLGGGKVAWRFDAAGSSSTPRSADLRFTAAPGVDGWFAFGFTGGSGTMLDSWAAAVGEQQGGGGMRSVSQFWLKSYSRSSFVALGREDGDVQTAYVKDGTQHHMHIHIADVTNISASLGALGKTLLDPDGTTEILYASHSSNAAFASRHESRSTAEINWATRGGGSVQGTSFFGGKQFHGEITLGKSKNIDNMIQAHALLMMLSWGWLLPMGVCIARFCKSWTPDGIWYRLHRAVQSIGLILAVVAFAIIVAAYDDVGAKHFAGVQKTHEQLGLTVMVIGLLQPLNAFIKRPHPPKVGEIKTRARFIWELVHKNLGRLGIVCGIVNVVSGLTLPRVGSFDTLPREILIIIWLAVVVLSAVVFSFEHSCRDRTKGIEDISEARDSVRANAAKDAATSAVPSEQVFNAGKNAHRIV